MTVDLMSSGYNFGAKMEETTVQEAATAGLQSVENLIRVLSHSSQQFHNQNPTNHSSSSSTSMDSGNTDYRAVTDMAVNKFKKFISLLDRTRTGHARFRRGPIVHHQQHQQRPETQTHESEPLIQLNGHQNHHHHHQTVEKEMMSNGSRIYCPTPVQRLPPPVLNNKHHHQLVKNGSIEKKEPITTINFAPVALTVEPPENDVVVFESAQKIILRWDSTVSEEARERMIFDGDRHEIDRYLQAVDEVQQRHPDLHGPTRFSI